MNKKERMALLREAALEASASGGRASRKAIADRLEAAGFGKPLAERMAKEAGEMAARGALPTPPSPKDPEEARLSPRDLSTLAKMADGLSGREFPLLCSMFLCLRARPHPTGRVRYEDHELIECAGYLTAREYRRDFASLHAAGLASCAVVGSKAPVQTVCLPWAPEPPKEGEEAETAYFAKGEGKRLAERLAKEGH